MVAPLPLNESERLRFLRRYSILDTPPEPAFDRVASMAARLLGMPVARVTLIDEKRQWCKACHGASEREAGREVSFCAHAILNDGMMIVPDTTLDERFADNPFVTGPASIRFYAGMPLKTQGGYIGTLCVSDVRPRDFGEEQQTILRDLSEIVIDALQLRLSILEKNQLSAAVTNVSSSALVTDPNHPGDPIIFCNPAFSKITGYEDDEVLGRNCDFLHGPLTDPHMAEEIEEARAARRIFTGVIVNYKKDGSPFWTELTVCPVFDPEGRLINFVRLQHDITKRKLAEERLRDSYEKLQQLEGLRDNLTNMIIHDMRQPLTVTMGFLEVLKQTIAGRNVHAEMESIRHAQNGANDLNNMVTSLLDVSRLEAGEMPLEITRCDLGELVKECTASQLALTGKCHLKVEMPDAPIFVNCDAKLIARVIMNLVGNALKFTPEEGEVRVNVAMDAGEIVVSVIDTGTCIAPELHDTIFQKFSQVGKSRELHSSGLGLTFCKLAVEAHGGTIGVISKEGEGNTFWFSLP